MAVRYTFLDWAQATVGSTRQCDVQRWFAERGLQLSGESWRKFLKPKPPASILLETWADICEAAGEPLSAFVEYRPTGRKIKRRRPKRRLATKRPVASERAPVSAPRASDFFRDRDG